MERRPWWATVYMITKSRTQLIRQIYTHVIYPGECSMYIPKEDCVLWFFWDIMYCKYQLGPQLIYCGI